MEQNKIRTYFLYAIGEILLVVIKNNCPASRDCLSVEIKMPTTNLCAVKPACPVGKYNICSLPNESGRHR